MVEKRRRRGEKEFLAKSGGLGLAAEQERKREDILKAAIFGEERNRTTSSHTLRTQTQPKF